MGALRQKDNGATEAARKQEAEAKAREAEAKNQQRQEQTDQIESNKARRRRAFSRFSLFFVGSDGENNTKLGSN